MADHYCESQLDPLSLLLFHKAEKDWRFSRAGRTGILSVRGREAATAPASVQNGRVK